MKTKISLALILLLGICAFVKGYTDATNFSSVVTVTLPCSGKCFKGFKGTPSEKHPEGKTVKMGDKSEKEKAIDKSRERERKREEK